MAGYDVSRPLLDQKAGETIIHVRQAFRDVETIFEYLAAVPSGGPGDDPLTTPLENGGKFGYTEDEAYLLRLVFEGLHALPVAPLLAHGRRLTGLS